MNFHLLRPMILAVLLLCGCNPNRPAPPTPQPYPAPTALTKRINTSLQLASQYLIQHQAPDGSWKSETYGFLKDGSSLTPHVAAFLNQLPHERFHTTLAMQNARQFLRTVGRENLVYAVYSAADIVRIFADDTEIQSTWLEYLRQHQLTENLNWQLNDAEYGGWSYAMNPPHRPADLKNRGPWDW